MIRHAAIPIVAASLALTACGGGGGGGSGTPPIVPPAPDPLTTGPAACQGGFAGDFPCSGLSLASRVPLATLGASAGNDIWGWVDPVSGNEYAIIGLDNGVAFVDVTDPGAPSLIGRMNTQTGPSVWRDIKVYADHAYVVADNVGNHGMQVFDLTRLRFGQAGTQVFQPDAVHVSMGLGSAHNIAINEDTGFAYVVGDQSCSGLNMIDLSMPTVPSFSGCHGGNTHDTQCVAYAGPDPDHAGREICVSSNGDAVEIVNVTDKTAPLSLATLDYPELGFVHQGWLTEDHRYFLFGDELDEGTFGVNTRTHVLDLTDLDNPVYVGAHEAATPSIDHNLYVLGNRVFEANYSSGLRVLEIDDPATASLTESAFFDTVPANDALGFVGAWSVYPYLPSGTLLVSDTESGLFVLTMP